MLAIRVVSRPSGWRTRITSSARMRPERLSNRSPGRESRTRAAPLRPGAIENGAAPSLSRRRATAGARTNSSMRPRQRTAERQASPILATPLRETLTRRTGTTVATAARVPAGGGSAGGEGGGAGG
jgi:hypothetical protein